MGEEILYSGLIDTADLQQLIGDCQFAPDALFLGEQMPVHVVTSSEERQNLLRFTKLESCSELSFATYTSGRIFQEDGELRWEQQDNHKTRVIYLGSVQQETALRDRKLKPNNEELQKLKQSDQPRYYYLFGERLKQDDLDKIGPVAKEGDFAEVRIHRILRYPKFTANVQRVRLVVCEYVDQATGQIKLFRFQGLKPA